MNRRLSRSVFGGCSEGFFNPVGWLCLALITCTGCTEPRWSSYRANAFNPGWLAAGRRLQVLGIPSYSGEIWRFSTQGAIFSTPVFGPDGTVYFGSCDGKIYGLDPGDGHKKWEFQTGDCVYGVLVNDNGVYATSADKNLYALDYSLNPRWQFLAGERINTPPLLYGSAVYFATEGKSLYAVDVNGHKARWISSTGDFVMSSPAAWVSDKYGPIVIVGSMDHNVYAFDQETGNKVWNFTTGDQVLAAPAIDITTGILFIGSMDGKMYALNASTGAKIWEFTTFPITDCAHPDPRLTPMPDNIATAAIALPRSVYFATECYFYGLDRYGNMLWNPPAGLGGELPARSPILNVSNGFVYVPAYHSLFRLDPRTHSIAYLGGAGLSLWDPALGPKGLVVVGSLDGALYALFADH